MIFFLFRKRTIGFRDWRGVRVKAANRPDSTDFWIIFRTIVFRPLTSRSLGRLQKDKQITLFSAKKKKHVRFTTRSTSKSVRIWLRSVYICAGEPTFDERKNMIFPTRQFVNKFLHNSFHIFFLISSIKILFRWVVMKMFSHILFQSILLLIAVNQQ